MNNFRFTIRLFRFTIRLFRFTFTFTTFFLQPLSENTDNGRNKKLCVPYIYIPTQFSYSVIQAVSSTGGNTPRPEK